MSGAPQAQGARGAGSIAAQRCAGVRVGHLLSHCVTCARTQAGRGVAEFRPADLSISTTRHGVIVMRCSGHVPEVHVATVAPIPSQVCDIGQPPETGGNRWRYVLGGVLLVMAAATVMAAPSCPWPDPGAEPFRGDQGEAVMRLEEIPVAERRQLADMVRQRYGWRRVMVTRDAVDGGRLEHLRHMNFGAGRVCAGPVDRSMWPAGRHESGLAFSVGRWSVITFDSCRNVALATEAMALLPPAPPTRESMRRSTTIDDLRAGRIGPPNRVPEPAGWALGLVAVLACLALTRRKR